MTVISHRHQFVFIKTRKTAGSSLELALAKHAGPDDVITPVAEGQRKELGFPGPQNDRFLDNVRPGAVIRGLQGYADDPLAGERTWLQALRDATPSFYHQHMSARHVRQQLGGQRWARYFTFTVERNPWALAVSRYRFRHKRGKAPESFREFLDSGIMARKSNFKLYADGERPMVDYIVRMEHLAEDLAEVSDRIGYPENLAELIQGIHAKSGDGKVDYRTYYDGACCEIVARECAREIELMGYTFEP
ncbi:sulfotransferase family 2 domain-containing protein [Halorhodospira halophila]|uniref:sulfotransferase family 2 domain-containing protein n=1 Tax=Halorhodospira halophila TaxID=1053 RepID=UPI001913DE27|nr:sulfotransferase family 2 domain-containing protein [Halorhodospira halophila]MBK5935442.1 hypothetical protein [Halorhodospira halophila]